MKTKRNIWKITCKLDALIHILAERSLNHIYPWRDIINSQCLVKWKLQYVFVQYIYCDVLIYRYDDSLHYYFTWSQSKHVTIELWHKVIINHRNTRSDSSPVSVWCQKHQRPKKWWIILCDWANTDCINTSNICNIRLQKTHWGKTCCPYSLHEKQNGWLGDVEFSFLSKSNFVQLWG